MRYRIGFRIDKVRQHGLQLAYTSLHRSVATFVGRWSCDISVTGLIEAGQLAKRKRAMKAKEANEAAADAVG